MDIGSQRYTGSIKIQKYPKYFGSTHISPKTVGWQRCAYGNFIFTWVIIVRLSKNRGPSCTCQSNSRAYPHCPCYWNDYNPLFICTCLHILLVHTARAPHTIFQSLQHTLCLHSWNPEPRCAKVHMMTS